jgi:hypothetical protein
MEQGDVSTVVEIEEPSGLGWLLDGSLLICAGKLLLATAGVRAICSL